MLRALAKLELGRNAEARSDAELATRLDGTLVNQVTRGPWSLASSGGVFWVRQAVTGVDGDWMYFTAMEKSAVERHFYRIRLDGTGMQRLSVEDGVHRISMSPNARYYTDAASDARTLPVMKLARSDGSEAGVLARARFDLLENVTIDMLGINDEHIAHRDLALGEYGAGHEKYDAEYVLDREPDIILLVDALDDAPRDQAGYAGLAGGIILARIDMLNTPRLWEEYQARSVEIAEGKWLNLLARRDASEVLARTDEP